MIERLTQYHWAVSGAGAGCVLSCGVLYFVYRDWTPYGVTAGVIGILLLLLWVWLDLRRVRNPGERAAIQFGLTSMLIVAAGLGLAAMLQVLSVRFDTRWDLTSEGRYTPSEHAQSVLSGLNTDVTAYAIFRKGSEDGETFSRMAKGALAYTSRLQLVEVDPLFDVALLRQVVQSENEREQGRMSEYGTVVLISDHGRQRLDGDFSETALVNALIRLESDTRHDVCWSVGHGERGHENQIHPAEMGVLMTRMTDQNYKVRDVRTATEGVPQECDLLIVASPKSDWIPAEREALLKYIAHGGRALILLDPHIQGVDIPDFADDLRVYGVTVGADLVMEADRNHLEINEANEPLQFYYGSNFSMHSILELRDGMWAIQFARSVQFEAPEAGGQEGRTLIEASQMSWAEESMEISPDAPPSPDPDEAAGRIGMAALVEITHPHFLIEDAPKDAAGRLVVFGDSDFATNQLSSLARNGDIFLNAVAWLVGEDDQLGQREDGEAQFFVLSGVQLSIAMVVALFVGPGGALFMGVLVLIRRRRG